MQKKYLPVLSFLLISLTACDVFSSIIDIETTLQENFGDLIAFTIATYEGNSSIALTTIGKYNVVELTDRTKMSASSSSWSPDGCQIVFAGDQWDSKLNAWASNIYVMDWDGSNQIQLTQGADIVCCPVWSPADARIAFLSMREGNWEIYILEFECSPNGEECKTTETNITSNEADDGLSRTGVPGLTWSPDGRYLAFFSDQDALEDIFVIDVSKNDSVPINLTGNNFEPPEYNHLCLRSGYLAWSPNADQIAFAGVCRSSNANITEWDDIHLLNIYQETDNDGDLMTINITHSQTIDGYGGLTWSPDGSYIAFSSRFQMQQGKSRPEIYTINVEKALNTNDSVPRLRLTNNQGLYFYVQPAWQPQPCVED